MAAAQTVLAQSENQATSSNYLGNYQALPAGDSTNGSGGCGGGTQLSDYAYQGDSTPDSGTAHCMGNNGNQLRPGTVALSPDLMTQLGAQKSANGTNGTNVCAKCSDGTHFLGVAEDQTAGSYNGVPIRNRVDIYNPTASTHDGESFGKCLGSDCQLISCGKTPEIPAMGQCDTPVSPPPVTTTPPPPGTPPPPAPPQPDNLTDEGTHHPPNPDPQLPPDMSLGGCDGCGCVMAAALDQRKLIKSEAEATRKLVTEQFAQYHDWIVYTFYTTYILPALMDLTQQLSTVGMQQVQMIGAFFDATQQLDNQRLMQSMTADAHKEYQPTTDMCVIGTAARGLGAADRNAEVTAGILARRSQTRQLGNGGGSGMDGPLSDRNSRMSQFVNRYCDVHDNNNGLKTICTASVPATSVNRDIDYTRTIDQAETLDVDMAGTGTKPTSDEQDLIAMESNLFANDLFQHPGRRALLTQANQANYLEARSIIAKRSVAENSFFAIAGLKSAGGAPSTTTAPYVQVVLKQLGVNDADAKTLLGARPSYYALMDVLGQKIYQDPEFFINLYDTPDNVARKDVAMQAIGLMMDRDTYKSELRSEADMAVLLELNLMDAQAAVQTRINWATSNGKAAAPAPTDGTVP